MQGPMEVPDRPKPMISLDDTDYEKISELAMESEVVITARGKVVSLDRYDKHDKQGKKIGYRYSARLELEGISMKPAENRGKMKDLTAKMLNIKG